MRTTWIEPTYAAWRERARELLTQGVKPEEVMWCDDRQAGSLFAEIDGEADKIQTVDEKVPMPRVSAAFLDLAECVAAHNDPQRWGILYHLLWRHTLGGERHLLEKMTDPQLRMAHNWSKAVRREIHKMHAFVRFRLVGVDEATGREEFIAWFEPEYHIVKLATPFFVKRFANMDWAILTPKGCAHWNGATLLFSHGVSKEEAPEADAQDDLWRTYYRSIFNPARLKVKAMTTEMPKRYWKNLPEATIIDELIGNSAQRVNGMMETELRPARPAPKNAYLARLREMNEPSSDVAE